MAKLRDILEYLIWPRNESSVKSMPSVTPALRQTEGASSNSAPESAFMTRRIIVVEPFDIVVFGGSGDLA
ncbi:MAG: hypothetical protein ACTSP2_05965, partial [Alphaproteobacteria bacterium]